MSDTVPLRSNPRFTRLWSARVVSRFGSALSYVVLIWLTYAETGSSLAVAYVGLAEFIPTVAVGLFSGALVDRFDRRRVIVLSVLGRSAAMGGLVVTLELFGFRLPFILLASVVFSILATFFGPGSQALLPEIVPRDSLADANGLFESSEAIVGIVGSSLAGVFIVIVGAVPSLGIDAASYLVAALFIALIGGTSVSRAPPVDRPSLLGEVREGLAYLRRALGLLEVTVAALVLNFWFAFVLTFLVIYTTELLHGSAVVFGALETLIAGGWGIGGLLVGRLRLTRYTGRLWVYSAFVEGGAIVAMVLVPRLAVAVPLFLAVGILQGVLNVAGSSTVQAVVPERLQGRYFATENMVSFAAIPAAQIAGGVLILLHGISFTFLLAGVGSLATGGCLVWLKDLRRFGYDPRPPG
ncbi:MAG: MFS transporter [Thermoplasmata archaeon]